VRCGGSLSLLSSISARAQSGHRCTAKTFARGQQGAVLRLRVMENFERHIRVENLAATVANLQVFLG
jgi:hypothetical protein